MNNLYSQTVADKILNGRESAWITVKQVNWLTKAYSQDTKDYVKHRSYGLGNWTLSVAPNGAGVLKNVDLTHKNRVDTRQKYTIGMCASYAYDFMGLAFNSENDIKAERYAELAAIWFDRYSLASKNGGFVLSE